MVEKDYFIYNPRISNFAPVGPISRNHRGTGVMSPLYSVFKFNNGYLDFFETYFSTTLWYEYLESIANYGARFDRMNITVKDFYKMPLPFPTLPEQTKIASFLTAVDQKIQALKKKEALLAQYKKGVMQKLFSQELRFKPARPSGGDKNGKDFPEWEMKKLGEVCEITIGEFVIKTKQNPNGKYPVFNGGVSPTGHYDEFNNNGNKIIISARGANAGFVNFQKEKYWAGNSCYSIDVFNKDLYSIQFYFYYIKMFEKTFTENQQAANIPSVSKKDAENFEIQLPSLPEQTAIANFLTSLDEKIKQVQEQIAKTAVWKKGLLQQMFV